MTHNITVEGGTSARLPTAGKYCDRDIVVTATGGDYADGYETGYETGYGNGKTDGLTEFIGDRDYITTGNATMVEAWKYFSTAKIFHADFPFATLVESSAFNACSDLVSANFPLATKLENNAFGNCKKLVSVYIPLVEVFGGSVFIGDTSLEAVESPVANTIWEKVFSGCTALKTVVLRLNRVCALKQADAFDNTPIANGTGFVYVPDNLVEQYKTADNWSTYASQIKPISELEE